jgi:hypothetical protein
MKKAKKAARNTKDFQAGTRGREARKRTSKTNAEYFKGSNNLNISFNLIKASKQ